MKKSFLLTLLMTMTLAGCNLKPHYEIETVCELNTLFNYEVKWEVTPRMEGDVVIYMSPDPTLFDMTQPAYQGAIADGKAVIVPTGVPGRRYFKLCFPNGQSATVGTRAPRLQSVHNFRDMGGYENDEHRSIRWGMLYRSGRLDSINYAESRRISRMNIKTLIDLRTPFSTTTIPPDTNIEQYFSYPISSSCPDPRPLLEDCRFKRNDARLYMQDVYQDMLITNTDNLRSIFELLQDETNYPVVITGIYGNVKTSIVIALLMYALDVPEETMLEDYVLSNRYVDFQVMSPSAKLLSPEGQAAVTAMLSSEELYMTSAFRFIERRFGSIDNYLQQVLNLDRGKRDTLKEILLEDNTPVRRFTFG
jgi:protein-tyrosine phosphatase